MSTEQSYQRAHHHTTPARRGSWVIRPLVTSLLVVAACRRAPSTPAPSALYDPPHALGPLFVDVQMARVFPDSKTLVDARPAVAPAEVARRYEAERAAPGFDLRAFVARTFEPPGAAGAGVRTDSATSMEEHIRALRPALTRPPTGRTRARR